MSRQSFTLGAGESGRVDRVLVARFPGIGRRRWASLFAAGAVEVDGARARKGDLVGPGSQVTLREAPDPALAPVAQPELLLEVLHVDAALVAVAKPAGLPSQPLRAGETGTVANALVARFPECAAAGRDPREAGLVHRLDRGTSGALIAARDAATWQTLRRAFAGGEVEKRYLALVAGAVGDGSCDAPLRQVGRRAVLARADSTAALPAATGWRAIAAGPGVTLLAVTAATGRMHQVRAHLAHIGAPITGDTLYGGAPLPGHDGFFLHAASITLPLGRETLVADAPLPPRFASALAACALA
jgi:23S rRNA pseudouridine1911/1915/1917 synthase